MRKLFPAYYKPDDQQFKELWEKGTIALDANVLLNLHRYPVSARDNLLAVLEKLADRLFVPYQAALEYQRNRLSVLADQAKRFGDVRKVIKDAQAQLEKGLNELQLKKRHAVIEAEPLIDDVRKRFLQFTEELDSKEREYADLSGEDAVRSKLDVLLEGRIGPRPEKEELKKIYEEGEERYKCKRPPGYQDKSKAASDGTYFSDGLLIQRQFGDLLLWKQVLKRAKDGKISHLMLITDDEKADWSLIINDKPVGPRPELIEEAKAEGQVSFFYTYNSERFMKYAKETLGLDVKPDTIAEIRAVAEDLAARRHTFTSDAVIGAVARWLTKDASVSSIQRTGSHRIDCLVNGSPAIYIVGKLGPPSVKGLSEISSSARKVVFVLYHAFPRNRHLMMEYREQWLAQVRPVNVDMIFGRIELLGAQPHELEFVPDANLDDLQKPWRELGLQPPSPSLE